MKAYMKEFCKRGMMFAWGGPVIVAIIWHFFVSSSGNAVNMLSTGEVILGVISSVVLAFIAAGITTIYQIEKLPRGIAAIIHMAVLYVDYLTVYLLNGWIDAGHVVTFSIFFIGGFAAIWAMILLITTHSVRKMNQKIENGIMRD